MRGYNWTRQQLSFSHDQRPNQNPSTSSVNSRQIDWSPPDPTVTLERDASNGRSMSDATLLLMAVEKGDQMAAEKLLELLYEELRQLAFSKMAREAPGQ